MTAIIQFLISLDQSVFKAINSLAGKSSVLNWLARVGADDHIIPVVLTLLVFLVILLARDRQAREVAFTCFLCTVIAFVMSMVILFILNGAFFRPRPYTSMSNVHLLFYHNTDSSFPSNAATMAFVMAISVFMYYRKVGSVMLALAVYVGLARVFCGVHYPLDIVSGAMLGLGSAFLTRAAEPLYRPLAVALNRVTDRLLASWQGPQRAVSGGGESK